MADTEPQRWCTWEQVAPLFNGVEDPSWADVHDSLGHDVRDPWEHDEGSAPEVG